LLWNYLPKLRFVQFPWRWMAVLAVVFALFAATTTARRMRVPSWIALALMLALTGTFLVRHTWWDTEDVNSVKEGVDSGAGFEGTDEYDPLGDDHSDIPKSQPPAKLIGEGKSELRVTRWTAEDRVVIAKSGQPAIVRLRLLQYPAWSVTVNGKSAKTERTASYDAILVPIPSGESRIEARFTQTKDRPVGGTISVLSVLAALVIAWTPKRQRT
jgi:hypothetical protein